MNKLTNFYKYDKKGQQKIQHDQKEMNSQIDKKTATQALVKNENPEESDYVGADQDEYRLEQFNANPDFGPCVGIGRERRWKNADKLGLSPPIDVLDLIYSGDHNHSYLDKYIF